MPVVRKQFGNRTPRDRELVQELVAELRHPQAIGQPAVEIREMSRGLRHVYVIWDRWDECEPEARDAVVREAFSTVEGPDFEKSIAITVAATTPEAVEAGMLPVRVKPLRANALDDAVRKDIRQAMIDEGASTLGDGWLPDLAFANSEQAGEVVERLRRKLPNVFWSVEVTQFGPG